MEYILWLLCGAVIGIVHAIILRALLKKQKVRPWVKRHQGLTLLILIISVLVLATAPMYWKGINPANMMPIAFREGAAYFGGYLLGLVGAGYRFFTISNRSSK